MTRTNAMHAAVLLLAASLLPAGAAAQPRGPAERNAVELKQGMTPQEVQKLLGKPRRTALRADPGYARAPAQGALQWTYVWGGASSTERTLLVDFADKGAGVWVVNSWAWPGN